VFTPETVVVNEIYTTSPHINEDHLDFVDVSKPVILAEIAPGRDYFDFIFLSGKTEPDFGYLDAKFDISNYTQLYDRILESCQEINFQLKSHDFEKLVFDPAETKKVLLFKEYVQQKKEGNAKH
jgi:hypothetical protein